jgi:large subunit ribosomal protein L29
MDIREIRKLSNEALLDALEDQRQALYNLRFQKAASRLEDQNAMRKTRRIIARLLTVQGERARGVPDTAPSDTETKGK